MSSRCLLGETPDGGRSFVSITDAPCCTFAAVPASDLTDLSEALGTLAPPPRFASARLTSYRAESAGQERALEAARRFARRVEKPPSLLDRLRSWMHSLSLARPPAPPHGLYLVGPAGTGKTHLMAALYHRLMPEVPCAFMHSSQLFRTTSPPEALARALARRGADGRGCRVVLLDEVELDDAANEARLATFLRVLGEEGVALGATSNARPNEFLSLQVASGGAHRRFLTDALSGHCEVVFVEGTDRRRGAHGRRRGAIYIGPREQANLVLRKAYEADERDARWVSFDEVRQASTEIAHHRLMERILSMDSLYIHSVELRDTDDALRLLRIVDDLYVAPEAPALFFAATSPPEAWLASEAAEGVAGAIAEKFTRTASRLYELCRMKQVSDRAETDAKPANQRQTR